MCVDTNSALREHSTVAFQYVRHKQVHLKPQFFLFARFRDDTTCRLLVRNISLLTMSTEDAQTNSLDTIRLELNSNSLKPIDNLTTENDTPPPNNEDIHNENPVPKEEQTLAKSLRSKALRPFVIISSSYLLFTITDGAIRMIVLLHAYNNQFSALEVSIMFMLYELAGVFTNLAAGFMGAKWGIKFTLITGLLLQLVSYGMLFGWRDDWSKSTSIIYVTIAQMFAGVSDIKTLLYCYFFITLSALINHALVLFLLDTSDSKRFNKTWRKNCN